mmetsp:Transcript_2244/g.2559  ORF Transcript_2244/g.2559 Transcript_2244/m.2559 type:complete len:739 (-) Transcript_2244:419-2635(-)
MMVNNNDNDKNHDVTTKTEVTNHHHHHQQQQQQQHHERINEPSDSIWIGIDLGTSNSACAVWDSSRGGSKWIRLPGVTKLVGNKSGRTMPSVVRFIEDDKEKDTLVGFPALMIPSAENDTDDNNYSSSSSSSSILRSVKRLLGKRYEDLDTAWVSGLDFDVVQCDNSCEEDEEDSLQLVVRTNSATKVVTTTPQKVLTIELEALRKACQAYLDLYRVAKNLRVPGGGGDELVNKKSKSPIVIDNVVVGVPAHFSQRHVTLVKEACRRAGFNGFVGTCLESTAAAVSYGLTLQERSKNSSVSSSGKQKQQRMGGGPTIMVIDMGGGTTDITIATSRKNNIHLSRSTSNDDELSSPYRVLVTQGDERLGGDDIDQAIMVYCQQQQLSQRLQRHQSKQKILNNNNNGSLWSACRKAKESLCHAEDPSPSETIIVDTTANATNRSVLMTQETFENIIMKPWLRRARDLIFRAHNDLKEIKTQSTSDSDTSSVVSGIEIEEVILVGGTTRIPAIRRMIQDVFPGIELSTSLNPISSVAQGLAIQAAIVSKQIPIHELKSAMMLDCVPHAIGVQLDNRFLEIIPRNTLLPAIGSATFLLANKYQAGVTIRAVEKVDVDTYEPMSKEDFAFLLRKLSPTQFEGISERTIQVGMKLDTDGRFIVSVFDENDPEQVRKKNRFEKCKKGKEVVGELDYIKDMILAESDITNEQITLVVALVSVVVLYIAVKMAFTDPLVDNSNSISGS